MPPVLPYRAALLIFKSSNMNRKPRPAITPEGTDGDEWGDYPWTADDY
jgi:hypothetical protein